MSMYIHAKARHTEKLVCFKLVGNMVGERLAGLSKRLRTRYMQVEGIKADVEFQFEYIEIAKKLND